MRPPQQPPVSVLTRGLHLCDDRDREGVYQVKGISVSPREGYPPQAKFVVSMALLSWELNLVREDYLICNTPFPTPN